MADEVAPSEFRITCPQCHTILSFDDFIVSIVLHGLIILDNPNVFRFGCTCRFCKKATLIKKFSKKSPLPEEVINLYNCISEGEPWYYDCITDKTELGFSPIDFMFSGKWKYNSFPYLFIHPREPFVKSIKMFFSETIDTAQNDILDRHFPRPNRTISLEQLRQGSFFSFLEYSLDTPPFSFLLGFKEDEIDELVAFENEQKKKVFPRYTLNDQGLETVQSFCWTHMLQWIFYQKMGVPLRDQHLLMTSKKRLVQETYDFMNMLDQIPGYELYIEERLIRFFSLHNSLGQEQIFEQMMLPSKEDSIYPSGKTREKIAGKVWDHFNKDYIQEMLLTRAEKFILELIELSGSICFSRSLLWDIKDRYLLELHNAVASKYQRRVEQKKDEKFWHKQGEKAEKSFSEVKIISRHRSINKIKIHISKLKKVVDLGLFNGPVLLLGERGTGKTLFAKAIHYALKLPGTFQVVDCGVKSENLFESELFGHVKGAFTDADRDRKGAFETATGGTIFLDEIGNINSDQQKKLLRVLQDRKYESLGSSKTKTTDAFIIAATNADLEQMVEDGEFRGDLFDRLNQELIKIPPLRERKMDIPLFFKHLKTNLPMDSDLETDLKQLKYNWPGNVRELISIIERIERRKIMEDDTSPICFDDLPDKIKDTEKKSTKHKKKNLPGNKRFTDEQLIEAMAKFNNVKKLAAKELKVTPKTIWERWKKIQNQ